MEMAILTLLSTGDNRAFWRRPAKNVTLAPLLAGIVLMFIDAAADRRRKLCCSQ